MVSRKQTNIPRRRDPVYKSDRLLDNEQPNGYVLRIDWDCREVIVKFYSDQKNRSKIESFDLDDFFGAFSRNFGGTWHL